ncbi:MAG: hypothetical protein AABM43_01870 [Actinomycetota bacterium]
MFKRMRGRVTFSNVVALMALFFALGGSVYAAQKFSGKLVKANSLPGNRITKNSLTTKQIKDSSLTAVKSANALAHVTYQSTTATLDSTVFTPFTVTATCPTGLKAIGGGVTLNDQNNGFFNDENITPDHTGYTAHVFSGSVNSTVTVTAVCISVVATTP